jgi:DNA-binding PadR family transcriptional regulator
MKQLTYLILNAISVGRGPVTWYQLERMYRSRGLQKYLDKLDQLLDKLIREEMIIQKDNDGKPKILTITEKGQEELNRLKDIYRDDINRIKG